MPAGSWLGALILGFISDKYAIMVGCIIWYVEIRSRCTNFNTNFYTSLWDYRLRYHLCFAKHGYAHCRPCDQRSLRWYESAQVPVYISEISPPSLRGRLVGSQQGAITWGILIMYYISFACSYIGGQTSTTYSESVFRIPWGVQMVPAGLLFLGMMFLPESPAWLARKDRWEESKEVLILVHGKGDPNSPFVQAELQEISDMCEFERRNADVTYLELFKPQMIHRTFIGIWTQIWSQLTGMNVMMYYITYVFGVAGYSGNAGLLASSIQYIINVVMTVPTLIWVDRWGRRPTLLIGAALMMTWMYANGGIMATYGEVVPGGIDGVAEESMHLSGAPAKGLIACTYLFVASYAPTWGPVSWVYPPELHPHRVRGKAVALATSANWAFNTALGLFNPMAFANIRWQTYIIFGVFLTVMWIHGFFLFPKTASKTLEETEQIFEDPNGIPYIGTPAWKTTHDTKRTAAAEWGDVEALGAKLAGGEKIAATHAESTA